MLQFTDTTHAGARHFHEAALEHARDDVWGYLAEGVFDPYILKAVFLAGGGGSGKGFISNVMFGTTKDQATTGYGLKSVNSDDVLTALARGLGGGKNVDRTRDVGMPRDKIRKILKKQGLSDKDVDAKFRALRPGETLDLGKDLMSPRGQGTREFSKKLISKRESLFTRGRLGLIIDGTGTKPQDIKQTKARLEAAGYDTYMVFVDTDVEVAVARNQDRERKVDDQLIRDANRDVKAAYETQYKGWFGPRIHRVDNSKRLVGGELSKLQSELSKVTMKFLSEPLRNKLGWEWLKAETEGMPPAMLKKVTWIGKKRGQ